MNVDNFRDGIRTLVRYKSFSLINITGLSVGLVCCMFIMLYLQHELTYDRYHKNRKNIYRIQVEETTNQGVVDEAGTPFPLTPELINNFTELENTTRFFDYGKSLVSAGDKQTYEDGIIFAEPKFLNIFTFPLLEGNIQSALKQPNTIILTESIANKYFGNNDPMGQTLRLNNDVDFTVTGIVKDVPENSHFSFNFICSLASIKQMTDWKTLNQWGMYLGTYTYTLLANDVDVAGLENKIGSILAKYDTREHGQIRKLKLQPLTDIHIHSHAEGELAVNNYVANLYIIGTIGILILLVAGINFVNLSTVLSIRRAREVGVRKALGAGQMQLRYQYLNESVLLTFMAMLVSLLLVKLLLPIYNHLIGKTLEFTLIKNFELIGILFFLTIAVGILSGMYPAFVLAAFKPGEALRKLKSGNQDRRGQVTVRKVLVGAQFAISIVLITSAFFVNRQLIFLRNARLGFDKETMLVVQLNDDSKQKVNAIKNKWQTLPGVKAITASYKSPIGFQNANTVLYPRGRENGDQFKINLNCIDYDFFKVYGLEFLAGRNFSPDFTNDEQRAIVVNEATVKKLGFANPQDAIGNVYRLGINGINGEIIGVVKDFHIASMQTEIEPLVMLYWPEVFDVFSVKIQSADISETIAALEKSWKQQIPNFPFQYRFLDDYINSLYKQEEQTRSLVTTFSLLTILIACLGLFSLVAFSVENRTKEMGVRKVLGASVSGLIGLLSKDIVLLILFADIVASPIAWYAINKWLENFAYKTELSWWIFALAGIMALGIALLTVSWQSWRAATRNPVEALRYE